jgi:serine/threonine-protein kinase
MTADMAHALVGTVLDGSYRIEGLLGEGGMGAVYAATHLRLEKPVAVKVMARELTANAEALARFRREALVTSGLGHPHIVQVFDFSTTPTGEPFLVMEFLDGEDLDHRLRRVGCLPAADVVRMVKQIASALMATHNKGIVHRDLKPANIYLLEVAGETDFVKVLDFGISKVRSASTKLTRTSSIMGTPNYMSPEQAKGKIEDIDERTDQWALGCIAWECLSGQGPFVGENVPSILFQIVHEPPPSLGPKVAGLYPQVEKVLLRGLAKDKNNRFAKVDDFAAALEAALSGNAGGAVPSVSRTVQVSQTLADNSPIATSPSSTTFSRTAGELEDELGLPPARSKAWIWGAAVGAVAILILGGILLLRPGDSPKPVVASPPATPVAEPAPLPVAAPPTVPAVPSEPPEIKPEPPLPSPKPLAESKLKKSRRTVAPAPSGAPSDAVRSVPAPPRPAEKSEKGIQDKWRLD